MRAALLSLAFLSLLAPIEARGAETKIVVLHQRELSAEEELLVESLRIYTRDLGCEVRVEGTAPASPDAPLVEPLRSVARADGTDFLFWVGARDGGGATYYALDPGEGELRETQIGPAGASTAAQEVALKIRALLSSRRRRASAAPPAEPAPAVADASLEAGHDRSSPVSAPTDARSEPPAGAPPAPTSPVASVVARPTPPSAPDEGPRRAPRFALDAGFGVATPRDRTWERHGLVLDLATRVASPRGNGSLWIYAEGALSTHPTAIVRGFDVTLSDVPLTAGALLRLRLPHGSVTLGSRTTVHIFDISAAAPDGRAASSRQYGLGLGGLARVEAAVGRHLGAFLQASMEGVVPNQEFTIGGQPAASAGTILYGAVAGVSLTAP